MRKKLIMALFFVSAHIEDFAYYFIGNGKCKTDFSIETRWCIHDYSD